MTVVTRRLLHLHLAVRPRTYLLHHFSSSCDAGPPFDSPQPQPESQPSFSSYFSEVKATLQKEPPPHNRRHPLQKPSATPSPTPPLPKLAFLEGISGNISGFRSPSASSPPLSGSDKYVSLQELYERNVIDKPDKSATSSNLKPPAGPSFDAIRESLRLLRVNPPPAKNESDSRWKNDEASLARFNESLKLKPDRNMESPLIIGGSESSPSFLDKEKGESENDYVGSTAAMGTEFLKMYDYSELGTKLKMLRPEKEKKGRWFSLQELNERLAKLRLIEERESQGRMVGISFKDLRESLVKLSLSEDDETKMKRMQRLNVLSQLGGTPGYMLSPPKDYLVEKYFHPDNMSAAKKLKLELMKVRDEFKMSESDCGSARVQVAQLTTKIKYLSNVLHKKDKHSRKGLNAMVQRRKKLLKYLRRTNWDSYCLVLSKLGLRDSPDFKA